MQAAPAPATVAPAPAPVRVEKPESTTVQVFRGGVRKDEKFKKDSVRRDSTKSWTDAGLSAHWIPHRRFRLTGTLTRFSRLVGAAAFSLALGATAPVQAQQLPVTALDLPVGRSFPLRTEGQRLSGVDRRPHRR
ncbi:MAG: hypothetical protein U0163_05895 [Gemmatimonadaceae bacterium]